MLRLLTNVPNEIYLAFSGGVDSLAAAHFFKQGKKKVHLLHFNHGCEHSDEIERQCIELATKLDMTLTVKTIDDPTPHKGMSLEEYWREERYTFLKYHADRGDKKVVLCHHLDDAVETWIYSSLHGEGKLITPARGPYLRPFLITPKSELISYAERNGLIPVDDPYNRENHLMRNYIRANVMEHAYYINPGLRKVIKKKYLNENS